MQEIQETFLDGHKEISTIFGYETPELMEQFASRRKRGQDNFNSSKTTEFNIKQQRFSRNDPCPCGSGTKFKKCCGRTMSSDDKRLDE